MPSYQPLPTEATSRRFKGGEAAPVFCLFCSGFLFFGGQGVNIQKQLCIWENLESYHTCSGKDTGSYIA